MSNDPRKPPKIEPYPHIFFIEGAGLLEPHEVGRYQVWGTKQLMGTHTLKLVAKLHAWWVGGEGASMPDPTRTRPVPQLLKVSEVAEMLNVVPSTVLKWIHEGRVPYVSLPGGDYRLPMQALLSCLGGTFDLASALRDQDQAILGDEQRDRIGTMGELQDLQIFNVDFNERDPSDASVVVASRTFASSARVPPPGERVLLEDDEGNKCEGVVREVRDPIVLVTPLPNTWRHVEVSGDLVPDTRTVALAG